MKLYLPIILLLFVAELKAQQLPLFSQYRQNGFVINPALTAVDERLEANATYRRQWQQIPGGPETATAGYRHFLEDENMGLGGYFMFDRTGPTSSLGLNLMYSYHIDFDRRKAKRLSFGISAGIYQFRLNGAELITDEPDDEAIFINNVSKIIPDAGLGVVYYTDNYYFGASIPQAISINAKFEGDNGMSEIRRIAHFYLMGGYKYKFGPQEEHVFEPSVWAKYAIHSPVNVDFNAKFTFDNIIVAGLGYSTSKTMMAEFGVKMAQRALLSYAFSFHFSDYHSYLGFNHEIMVTYTFDAPEFYVDY